MNNCTVVLLLYLNTSLSQYHKLPWSGCIQLIEIFNWELWILIPRMLCTFAVILYSVLLVYCIIAKQYQLSYHWTLPTWTVVVESLNCAWLCTPMDYGLPGSSVHGISQARILKWVAMSFSREISQIRDQICVSHIGGWILYHWATKYVVNNVAFFHHAFTTTLFLVTLSLK